MADDVVAELDAELALIEQLPYRIPIHLLAQRARDEIVALRQLQLANVEGNKWLRDNDERVFLKAIDVACTEARAQALEEAATVCRLLGQGGNMETALACAAAIRVLKEKPHAD